MKVSELLEVLLFANENASEAPLPKSAIVESSLLIEHSLDVPAQQYPEPATRN